MNDEQKDEFFEHARMGFELSIKWKDSEVTYGNHKGCITLLEPFGVGLSYQDDWPYTYLKVPLARITDYELELQNKDILKKSGLEFIDYG